MRRNYLAKSFAAGFGLPAARKRRHSGPQVAKLFRLLAMGSGSVNGRPGKHQLDFCNNPVEAERVDACCIDSRDRNRP